MTTSADWKFRQEVLNQNALYLESKAEELMDEARRYRGLAEQAGTISRLQAEKEKEFVSVCCDDEFCFCGNKATRKVEDVVFHDDPMPNRHPLTSYVCDEHFRQIMRIPK